MRRAQNNSGSQVVRNLAYNPSFEASALSTILRTNTVQNPSCETAGSVIATRTNLFTNPSAETASGTVTVRSNLATNPGFETSAGVAAVRTNLATNPSFETASGTITVQSNLLLNPLGRVNNAHVDVGPNVTVVYDTTGAVVTHTNGAAPGNAFLGVKCTLVNGVTYYARAVFEDVTGTVSANISAHGNIGTPMGTVTSGTRTGTVTRREWSFVSTKDGSCRILIDMVGTGAGESFRLKEMILSEQPIRSFFDGSTPIKNEITNPEFVTDTSGWTTVNSVTRVNPGLGMGKPAIKLTRVASNTVLAQPTRVPVTPGEVISISALGTLSADTRMAIDCDFYTALTGGTYVAGAGRAYIGTSAATQTTVIQAGVPVRWGIAGITVPAGASFAQLRIYRDSSGDGDTWATDAMLERASIHNSYYSGQGDFAYAWTGAANASTSVQTAIGAAATSSGGNVAAFQSTNPLGTGTKSLRLNAMSSSGDSFSSIGGDIGAIRMGMVAGRTYTFSATQYIPGGAPAQTGRDIRAYYKSPATGAGYQTYTSTSVALDSQNKRRLSVTMAIPADATEAFVRLYNGHNASNGLGDVWWDDLLVEESPIASTYFDGATPAAGDFTYIWSGTAHASTSTQQASTVATIVSYWAANELKMYQSSSAALNGTKGMRFQAIRPSTFLYGTDGSSGIEVTAGQTVTISYYVRPSVTRSFRVGTVCNDTNPAVFGSWVSCTANVWTRVSYTTTVPAGPATTMTVYFNSETMSNAGDIYDIDCLLIEKSSVVGQYFDASTPIQNLLTNPSFETNTTGWAVGTVGTRDLTKAYIGAASVKVDTSASPAYTGIATTPSLTTGQTYTWSAYIWAPTGTFVNFAADCLGVNTTLVGNSSWQRVSVTGTYGGSNNLYIRSMAANQAAFWVDAVLLERATTASPYFEGTGDFTYSWAGTANASISYQQASGVASVGTSSTYSISSSGWSASGSKSVRIIPNSPSNDSFASLSGITLVTGKTYTLSATIRMVGALTGTLNSASRQLRVYHSGASAISTAAPNTEGATRLSVSFTVTDAGVYQSIRLYNGASVGGGDVWWDDILLEEGTTDGEYFDGSNPIQNLVTNTSFESDTTGYSAANQATLTRVASTALSGSYVGRLSFTGSTVEDSGLVFGSSFSPAASQIYTVSMDVLSDISRLVKFSAQGTGTVNQNSAGISLVAGVKKRISWTFQTTSTAPVGPVALYLLRNDLLMGILDIDNIMIERRRTASPYFYTGLGDFTYAWTGTANASTSEQRSVFVSGRQAVYSNSVAYQSTIRANIGTKSGAIWTRTNALMDATLMYPTAEYTTSTGIAASVPNTWSMWVWVPSGSGTIRLVDVTTGATGAPNTLFDQWERISVTFTGLPSGVHTLRLRAYTTVPTGTTIWWDNELLEASPNAQPYFDGTTAASADFTYAWTGAVNGSSSTQTAPSLPSVSNIPNRSTVWQSNTAANGLKSLAIRRTSTLDSYAQLRDTIILKPSTQYTVMFRIRADEATTLTSGCLIQQQDAPFTNQVTMNVNTNNSVTTLWTNQRFVFTTSPAFSSIARFIFRPSSSFDTVVYYDDLMIVEGDYNGDYLDGSKPFSKWDGEPQKSVSVGYPTQLFDIAGKPDLDLVGVGDSASPTVDGFMARTIYHVYEVTDTSGSWQVPLYYGSGAPASGFTFQTSAAPSTSMSPRFDFASGGGDINRNAALPGGRTPSRIHVAAIAMNQGLTSANFTTNGAVTSVLTLNPGTVGWTSGTIRNKSATGIKAVRTLVYYTEHDASTRLAVSRYLGNKYGANIL